MKQFTKNDSGFTCGQCGQEVPPLGYSSRDHCCFCLYSLHVDDQPGDRAHSCGALMEPVAVNPHGKKGPIIAYRCTKCQAKKTNIAARDDNGKLLIALTARPMD